MPEDAGARQDHPFVAHYDWPETPGDDRFKLTPERQAENAQHAADKQAVEGRRTLRLVLAAPIRRSLRFASAVERLEKYAP